MWLCPCLHATGLLGEPKAMWPSSVEPLHLHLLQAKGLLWRSGAEPTVVCTDGVCRLVRPGEGNGVSHEKWMRHMSQRNQLGPAGNVQSPQQQAPEGSSPSEEQTGEQLAVAERSLAKARRQCQPASASC